jgi:hypothetical protein
VAREAGASAQPVGYDVRGNSASVNIDGVVDALSYGFRLTLLGLSTIVIASWRLRPCWWPIYLRMRP